MHYRVQASFESEDLLMGRQTMRVVAVLFAALLAVGTLAEAAPAKTTIRHRAKHSSRVSSTTSTARRAPAAKKRPAKRRRHHRAGTSSSTTTKRPLSTK